MAKYDDLNTRQIFLIGIGSVVVTIVTILAVQYVFYLLVAGHQVQLAEESNYRRQNTVLAEQLGVVSRYGADPDTGNVTIPIDRAMEYVVQEFQSEQTDQPNDVKSNDAT